MQHVTNSHTYAGRPGIAKHVLFSLPAPLGSSVSAWPIARADSEEGVSGAGLKRRAVSLPCLLENSNGGLKPHCNVFSYLDARKTEAALGFRPHSHPPRKANEVFPNSPESLRSLAEYHQRAAADTNLRNCTPLPDVIKTV